MQIKTVITLLQLPPYHPFPVLTDGRIILRPIGPADLHDILDISYYDGQKAQNVAEAQVMQDKIHQNYQDGDSIHWGIIDAHTQKIAGTCGYYRGFANDAGELGCVLLPAFRGQGYMTAALQLAIDFGKNTMGLNQVWAATSRSNTRAMQLLERLHFEQAADTEGDQIIYSHREVVL